MNDILHFIDGRAETGASGRFGRYFRSEHRDGAGRGCISLPSPTSISPSPAAQRAPTCLGRRVNPQRAGGG